MGWGILGWGANDGGQLGANGGAWKPIEVIALATGLDKGMIKAVVAGCRHSLALTYDGAVWAWGDNSSGQLGDNLASIGGRSGIHWSDVFGPDIAPVYTPVRVVGPEGHGFLSDVVEIAAGGHHCLARRSDNTIWAWGNNLFGQLGDGTRDNRWLPVQVEGVPENATVTAIAAGYQHSLAVWIASERDSSYRQSCDIWAWGHNFSGQLGDDTFEDRHRPVRVHTARRERSKTENWLEIAAGGWHSLARRDDDTLWAWGCNDRGQLGDGTTDTSRVPVKVHGLPLRGRGIFQIAAGEQHNLAIVAETPDAPSSVWSWGFNHHGQLADGTMGALDATADVRSEPVQVVGKDLNNFVAVRGGRAHSLALCGDGTLWAWGDNFLGQLGNGKSTGSMCAPTKVDVSGNAWASIAAGAVHNLMATK